MARSTRHRTRFDRALGMLAVVLLVGGLCLFAFGFLTFARFFDVGPRTELPLGGLDGVALDSHGNAYVGAHFYYRVQMHDAGGKFVRAFAPRMTSRFAITTDDQDRLHIVTADGKYHYTYADDGNLLATGPGSRNKYRRIDTLAVLTFYIPRRIAFLVFRGQFEQHVAGAPTSSYGGQTLGWVGIYWVDEYAADPRGGVYFRTTTTADGIGPDTLSYGFAYRPNREGTPFGASGHRIFRLYGDWCWFEASDDSY